MAAIIASALLCATAANAAIVRPRQVETYGSPIVGQHTLPYLVAPSFHTGNFHPQGDITSCKRMIQNGLLTGSWAEAEDLKSWEIGSCEGVCTTTSPDGKLKVTVTKSAAGGKDFITWEALNEDIAVLGAVIKGGDSYNFYSYADLQVEGSYVYADGTVTDPQPSEATKWVGPLVPPHNDGSNLAGLSHYNFCYAELAPEDNGTYQHCIAGVAV